MSMFLINIDPHQRLFLGCTPIGKHAVAITVSEDWHQAPRPLREHSIAAIGNDYANAFPEEKRHLARLEIVDENKNVLGGWNGDSNH